MLYRYHVNFLSVKCKLGLQKLLFFFSKIFVFFFFKKNCFFFFFKKNCFFFSFQGIHYNIIDFVYKVCHHFINMTMKNVNEAKLRQKFKQKLNEKKFSLFLDLMPTCIHAYICTYVYKWSITKKRQREKNPIHFLF